MFSPLTIASYVLTRPTTSSDFTVSISCKCICSAVCFERPYFHFSETLSAELQPYRRVAAALPAEYGPVLLAWILSSTRWWSFKHVHVCLPLQGCQNIRRFFRLCSPELACSRRYTCIRLNRLAECLLPYAPSNTGVAIYQPLRFAARPICVSST